MPRDREKYLYDMLDSCRFLLELTSGEPIDRYVQDRMFRGAVQRELQIIGEAMIQLRSLDADLAEQIPEHDQIIRFRHVLVHGYHELDSGVVWHVVTNKLDALRVDLESLLKESPPQ